MRRENSTKPGFYIFDTMKKNSTKDVREKLVIAPWKFENVYENGYFDITSIIYGLVRQYVTYEALSLL